MTLPYNVHYYVAIDIGNTRSKIAWFSSERQIVNHLSPDDLWIVETNLLEKELERILQDFPIHTEMSVAWISTAAKFPIQDFTCWQRLQKSPIFVPIDANFPFPIQNAYATPTTLGTDRIVSVIAAQQQAKDVAVLVIDAGTAITYDFADEKGVYLGGGISPGLRMRFRALHEFTARLPFITEKQHTDLVGDSTQNSMLSGVINGTIAEIQGTIARYKVEKRFPISVFLTGGDALFLSEKLQDIDYIDEQLVLKGIAFLMLNERNKD